MVQNSIISKKTAQIQTIINHSLTFHIQILFKHPNAQIKVHKSKTIFNKTYKNSPKNVYRFFIFKNYFHFLNIYAFHLTHSRATHVSSPITFNIFSSSFCDLSFHSQQNFLVSLSTSKNIQKNFFLSWENFRKFSFWVNFKENRMDITLKLGKQTEIDRNYRSIFVLFTEKFLWHESFVNEIGNI